MSDPRIEAVEIVIDDWGCIYATDIPDMLAAADAVDPLRAALREPSDELVERLADSFIASAISRRFKRLFIRAVLAALAEEADRGEPLAQAELRRAEAYRASNPDPGDYPEEDENR